MNTHPVCVRCGLRQIQDWKFRMCRRCTRETGLYQSTTAESERLRVDRVHERFKNLQRVDVQQAAPNPVRIIDGVEYEVTWDGTNG